MSLLQNLDKNDEATNENIKMVLLVLEEKEENDKSTNDNVDYNMSNNNGMPASNDHFFNNFDKIEDIHLNKLSSDFAQMQMSSSYKKPTFNESNLSNLNPKLSYSSNNISNIWLNDNNEYNPYNNNDLGQNNRLVNEGQPPLNMYQNYAMNEERGSNSFYSQNYYPKNLNMNSSPSYGYNPYSPFYMSPNNNQYQNFQFYSNNQPDYFMNDDGFSLGRPHFFSQTHINVDEKKILANGCLGMKKGTPKKNSLVMKNGTFSSSNGFEYEVLNLDSKNLFEICKDQLGSRKIQNFFEKAGEEEKEIVFGKIESQILFLIKDVFGNYVVQKILEKGSQKIREMVYEKMKNNVLELTSNTYGCRVVQKALEVFHNLPTFQEKIIAELKSNVLKCIQNQNGNHVIQKCFETIKANRLDFIIIEVIENINNLAFHAYGCRVIQKILEYSDHEKTLPILEKLMENTKKLCECQFGNYIMQHIIEKGPSLQKEKVLQTVKSNFVEFSTNKFASNVAEKAVLCGPKEFRKDLMHNLLKNIEIPEFIKMMKDPYGNYVAQKLFANVDDSAKRDFLLKLNQPDVVIELRKDNYGKHVLSCCIENSLGFHDKR